MCSLSRKVCYARTGWLALALIPTTIAFFLLSLSGSKTALIAATALIGLSSGFVFSVAVSITSELFGHNSVGVNHNILITNIPLGSILYGLLAALVYEGNIGNSQEAVLKDGRMVCMGRNCYFETFVWWGFISLFGLASSSLLFLRTKAGYERSTKCKQKTSFELLTYEWSRICKIEKMQVRREDDRPDLGNDYQCIAYSRTVIYKRYGKKCRAIISREHCTNLWNVTYPFRMKDRAYSFRNYSI